MRLLLVVTLGHLCAHVHATGAAAYPALSGDPDAQCEPLPEWGPPVGIVLGSLASVGINIGQNMQADGIGSLPADIAIITPWKSRLWMIGLSIFVSCALVNFAVLAFAPASVLVPLESIQFVTNVGYSYFVKKAKVPVRMLFGVFLAVTGTVLTVVFGASGGGCHSIAILNSAWTSFGWWLYLSLSLGFGTLCLRVYLSYTKQVKAGGNPPYHKIVLPVTYTLYSSLYGGSQMIVMSKVFSELLSMCFQGDVRPLISPLFYISFILVAFCGCLWMVKLTQCLGLFDPLIILPMMVSMYILFGGIAGGIYFREFETLHLGIAGWWGWPLYVSGTLCVLGGLYFIATAGSLADVEAKQNLTVGAPSDRRPDFNAAKSWRQLKMVVAISSERSSVYNNVNGARMPSPGGVAATIVIDSLSSVSFAVSHRLRSSSAAHRASLAVPQVREPSQSFAPKRSSVVAPKRTSVELGRATSLHPNSTPVRPLVQPGAGRLSLNSKPVVNKSNNLPAEANTTNGGESTPGAHAYTNCI